MRPMGNTIIGLAVALQGAVLLYVLATLHAHERAIRETLDLIVGYADGVAEVFRQEAEDAADEPAPSADVR